MPGSISVRVAMDLKDMIKNTLKEHWESFRRDSKDKTLANFSFSNLPFVVQRTRGEAAEG